MVVKFEKKWHKHVSLLLIYGSVTLVMTYPLIFRLNELPVDVTDPQNHLNRDSFIFLWTFWWIKYSAFQLHAQPLFSDYIFHPHGTSLVFLPFTGIYGIVSLPFQLIFPDESGVIIAYSVIVFCSFVLAAYGMYLLATEVTGNSYAGFVAGLIYSFCANRLWNLSALNLFCFEFAVFFVFFLIKLLKNPSFSRGLWTGIFFALLFYSSLNYALFSSVLAIILTLAYMLARNFEGDYLKTLARNGLVALGSFSLIAFPFLAAIWSFSSTGELSAAKMDFEVPVAFSNDLLSFVIPSFYQKFYDVLIDFRFLYSRGIDWRVIGLKSFLGYTAVGLAVAGTIKAAGKQKWLWLLSFSLFLILSMGPYLHIGGRVLRNFPLPYMLLYKWIPLFQIARAPERMIALVMLSLSVLAAYGIKTVAELKPGRSGVVAALFSSLILLENFGAPFTTGKLPVPDIHRQMGMETPDYAILDIPMEEDMRPISMYFQIIHEKPILGGQVPRRSPESTTYLMEDEFLRAVSEGRFPEYYLDLVANPERKLEMRQSRQKLIENQVKYIFVHTWHMSHRDENFARKLIALLEPAELLESKPYLKGEILVYRMY